MGHALLIILPAAILAALWVVFLQVIEGYLKIYRRLKAPYVVSCPAIGEPAALELGGSPNGSVPQRHVRRCSRWPEHAECGQACLKQLKG